jgi:hypothetical protein
LSLIGFKKSLFDGVLDQGEDQVFMGESKLKKFMNTVETVTEDHKNMKAQDQEVIGSQVRRITKSLEHKTRSSDTSFQKPATNNQAQAVQDLFTTGIEFLSKLQQTMAEGQGSQSQAGRPQSSPLQKKQVSSFIERDPQTGQSNLKIPLPDAEVLDKAARALNALVTNMKK